MKYLGIDYGTKRTGLAVSSDDGSIAFPREVILTTPDMYRYIDTLITKEGIGGIVIGESKDRNGKDNAIMKHVQEMIAQLSLLVAIPIELEREDFSTSAAMRSLVPEKNVARSRSKKPVGSNDDRAAALILQRYLDKQ